MKLATVKGRFLAVLADSVSDPDSAPEQIPLKGTVILTPSVSAILDTSGEVPATLLPTPVTAVLDDQGDLSLNGTKGIQVAATTGEGVNPSGWTYRVAFNLQAGNLKIAYASYDIQLPPDQVTDLTLVAKVPTSTGIGVTRGVGIQSVTSANGTLTFRLTDATTHEVAINGALVTSWSGNSGAVTPAQIDAGIAPLFQDGQSATSVALSATYSKARVPLESFLLPGETLPDDGTVDAKPLFQRAVDAITGAVAFTGPRQIEVPQGSYRLESAIRWATGVGIKGAGRNATALLPIGDRSAIDGNQSGQFGYFHDDCVFEDFTVDAAGQSSTPADSWAKGIFIQFMRRARFERVSVKNTWMTGFGLDYLQDATFSQCFAENCGRGGTNDTGAGAGFGIATGSYDTESCSMVDCISINNKTHGFFTESNPVHNKHPKGFRLVGCYASGNHSGFNDGGSNGATVMGCQFVDNLDCGVYLARTPANDSSGGDGIISGCNLSNNGVAGVKIREFKRGGYTISGNTIARNGQCGIVRDTPGGTILEIPSSLVIRGNTIKDHPRSGILFKTASRVVRPVIVDNDIINSGTDTTATDRDGMTFYGPIDYATIRDNRIYDTGAGTTRHAIWLTGTVTTLSPVIQGNECGVTSSPAIRIGHTVTDRGLIKGNISRAAGWSDDLNRADGPLANTQTSVGGQTWTQSGTGTPQILGNQHAIQGATGLVISMVNNSRPDGVFQATAATIGADATTALVFRAASTGNYLAVKARTSSTDKRWTLVKRVATAETAIASLDAPSANGDVVRVSTNGTTVTVTINGVDKWSGTITEHATFTGWGVLGTSTTTDTRWDNFSFAVSEPGTEGGSSPVNLTEVEPGLYRIGA